MTRPDDSFHYFSKQGCRRWVDRSVNPVSARKGRLYPSHYYIFVHPALGTSYTPEFNKKVYHNEPIEID